MRIAIDLTPLLPGGENGGAKIMTLQLIKYMAQLEPSYSFLLLATDKNRAELKELQSHNIQIYNTSHLHRINALLQLKEKGFTASLIKLAHPLLRRINQKMLKEMRADLLFCPFTAPFYHHLITPVVSVIYDLQSMYLTHFFSANEYEERKKNFYYACDNADTLICISDFVRQTVIEKSQVDPSNIKTIYIRLAHRLPNHERAKNATLATYALTQENYLLYPANFWPHKNHKMLFAAFSLFCQQNPAAHLKLVCTGADKSVLKNQMLLAIKELGLDNRIVITEFLSNESFADLMHGSLALIFPSLYEGFGMPTLEAMANHKPVLCSNVTSLPEIVGPAAILFDPLSVTDMAHAMQRIITEPTLAETLIQQGKERVEAFGSEKEMAKEYLQVFKDTFHKNVRSFAEGEHA